MIDVFSPSASEFERLAHQTINAMHPEFRDRLQDVVVKVEEFARPEQLRSVGLKNKWQLSGLYEGRPVTEASVWESGDLPAVISLFRQPLLAEMRDTGVPLEDLVRHVVIHEAGHHFGFSDEEMHALEGEVRS